MTKIQKSLSSAAFCVAVTLILAYIATITYDKLGGFSFTCTILAVIFGCLTLVASIVALVRYLEL